MWQAHSTVRITNSGMQVQVILPIKKGSIAKTIKFFVLHSKHLFLCFKFHNGLFLQNMGPRCCSSCFLYAFSWYVQNTLKYGCFSEACFGWGCISSLVILEAEKIWSFLHLCFLIWSALSSSRQAYLPKTKKEFSVF